MEQPNGQAMNKDNPYRTEASEPAEPERPSRYLLLVTALQRLRCPHTQRQSYGLHSWGCPECGHIWVD